MSKSTLLYQPSHSADFYLLQAIDLAAESRLAGDPPFGSILVDKVGDVIRAERNTVTSSRDITAHPELKLARWAAQNHQPEFCRTLSMYTSCQPCSMCSNAIARAGIGYVMYALSNDQLQALKPTGHTDLHSLPVRYVGPALRAEAIAPLDGYFH